MRHYDEYGMEKLLGRGNQYEKHGVEKHQGCGGGNQCGKERTGSVPWGTGGC